ncbi:ParB/RepB/Spo0J family partition protein [Helicobacter sp.]|uniref:ParB/RepB/Spo0J family partition protein n=1 Tax=Helicobacter sp. TaxID=218 RepID=UPI0025BE8B6C|nr:ParB/RepB/Spo0J family partition protein [Helicobacter sp.]MCI5968772.1 ParB/RepB/Spo0J family partition protein [Helicobacter sp.]MDY2584596.1 ParB/RepB/Spo0J family partition protein [Helicobacter sp.]
MAKKGLGRGLGAILSEVEEAYQNDLGDNSGLVVELDIEKIKPNPLQPRKVFDETSLQELAVSIEEHGLLQPILVYEDSQKTDFYYLIAGERRLRASKLAKKESIKAIIVDVQTGKLRELALIENIQREDLNPIDLARSYKELIEDYGITHEEMAKRLSKSRTQITNTLRLLDLSKEVQELVLENKISQGHAKILVALPKEQQNLIANSIIGQKLSVHTTEKIVKNFKNTKSKNTIPNFSTNSLREQKNLSKDSIAALEATCVAFKNNGIVAFVKKNRLVVEFSNDEEVKKFSKILLI